MADFIKHLLGFRVKASEDDRLNPTHISLYYSLFFQWNIKRFNNPISVTRDWVMNDSKIGSTTTYTKCMHDLNDWGYIVYKPSKNKYKGSLVDMFDFDPSTVQDVATINTKTWNSDKHEVTSPKEYINSKKEKRYKLVIPTFFEVESFFSSKGRGLLEAQKFYKHYEGVGWVSGGTPIAKWEAIAEKWIMNSNKGQKNNWAQPSNSSSNEQEDYYAAPFN